ncbi:MAG: hypothetical protein AAB198_06920 [Actinomycetota bacterium]
MPYLLAAATVVLVVVVIVLMRRRGGGAAKAPAAKGTVAVESGLPRPQVAEFHVKDGAARVHFEVPLPAAVDDVLSELLGREAVEVVREKRHTLPLGDVRRVVALGRRGTEWVEVASIGLETPGELPPPLRPESIPHAAHPDFDPFERLSDLPQNAPGLSAGSRGESLDRLVTKLPAEAQARVRSQGIDPATADAPSVVIALMRAAGYQLTETDPVTYTARRAGQTTFIRVVSHRPGDYPELDETVIRKFVVDFGASGTGRGILLSEKWAPFEIYERERRDPRVRFVTRERLQAFVDALALA